MPYCSILQCKNDSRKNNLSTGGISYHRFPKDASVKEKWIDATGRDNWMPTKLSTICSEHFLVADFVVSDKGYRFIKPTALPTLKILNFFKHKSNDDNKMTCVQTDLGGDIVQLERKAVRNLDTLVSSSRSTPRKNKLKGRVRFCIEKIKKQSLKIKALQITNRRLKKKLKNIDEILTKLEEKFALAKEDLNRLKNTNINYILIK